MRTLLAAVFVVLLAAPAHGAGAGSTLLIDRPTGFGALPSDGLNRAFASSGDLVSDDGRYVVFESSSDALLPAGADPGFEHVFRRDRQTDTTVMVNTSVGGVPGNDTAIAPAISGDGNRVAFVSFATNLTPDANDSLSTYVKDLTTGVVFLVDRKADQTPGTGFNRAPVLDADGSVVAFVTGESLVAADTNIDEDVYRRDLVANTTTLVSRADGAGGAVGTGGAGRPSISADGGSIAFETGNNYEPAVDLNAGGSDVYSRSGNMTTLVSRITGAGTTNGNATAFGPAVSGDGAKIAFVSSSTNLIGPGVDTNGFTDIFVREGATTTLASRPSGPPGTLANAGSFSASISTDGTRIGFQTTATNIVGGVTDGKRHGYVRAPANNLTIIVTLGPGAVAADSGSSGELSLNADGTVAAFSSDARNLGYASDATEQVYAREPLTDVTEPVSAPGGMTPAAVQIRGAGAGAVSATGRYVVFSSRSDALVADDDNTRESIFLRDTLTGTTTNVMRGPGNVPANGSAEDAAISADGSRVAFVTEATNLVAGAPPSGAYVVDLASGVNELVSRADGVNGTPAPGFPLDLSLDADGSRVAFTTEAQLDPVNDTDMAQDVYVRDLTADTTTLVSRADGANTASGNGQATKAAINAAGTRVAFASTATNLGDGDVTALEDVHVRDLSANTTVLVSRADGAAGEIGNAASSDPSISGDGNLVTFESNATNLADGVTTNERAVHVRDVAAGTTRLVSRVGLAGAQADAGASSAAISADGTKVAYQTAAPNLVPFVGSTVQVFIRTLATGATEVASRADGAGGAVINEPSINPSISADGGCVVFTSRAPGLEPGGYPSRDFFHVHMRVVSGECPVAVAPTPTPTVTPEPTVTPTPDTKAPVISKVRVKRKKLSFRLSEAARVRIQIARKRPRGLAPIGTIKAPGAKGRTVVRFKTGLVRKLRRGPYVFLLRATDSAGNVSKPARAKLRVRKR